MREEMRKFIGQVLLGYAFTIFPEGLFKLKLAVFLKDNLKEL